MVNFSELAPEALTLASSAGVEAPEKMPELLPHVPAMSVAESKPTHLMTPGCWHLVVKSALLVGTDTVADAFALPFGPVQARLNWVVLLSAPEDSLPEVALEPDQPPEAVHDVAFVDDQVRVDEPPLVTVRGLAVSETVGPAAVTVTVLDALCVPPAPVQERVKVLLLVNAPVDALPDVARAPDQAPDAVQEVALVEDQLSVEDPPLTTDVGFAEIDTVGAGGGGGVPVTLTWAEALALPSGPIQVSE